MKNTLKCCLALLVFTLSVSSCSKDEPGEDPVEGKITSFTLRDHREVFHDMIIDNTNHIITNKLILPAYVNLAGLIASFSTDGTKSTEVVVKVNDVIQVNRITVNDFTTDVVYDIYVAGEKRRSYTVKLTKADMANEFLTFTFPEKAMEPYQPEINTETQTIIGLKKIPLNVDITELRPEFTTSDGRYSVVKVKGEVQESGVSVQDFTEPVVYTIEGEDGTSKDFTVILEKSDKAYLTNPIITGSYADPTVIRMGNEMYVYVTSARVRGYRSTNLVDWDRIGGNKSEVFLSTPNFTGDTGASMWAPDINYFDGQYVMYYSISVWGGGNTCGIGVGVSQKPEGPFLPPLGNSSGKLFVSSEIGVHNSIDPCFFEEDGKKYLFWGSFYGLYMTELTSDGMAVKDMSKKTKVAGDAFEAAYVHKRGNYYYLFVSAGTCCDEERSTYRLMVGRAEKPEGPYLSKTGANMNEFNTGYSIPNTYQPVILKGNDTFIGPGHNARIITDDAGVDWMLYHSFVKDKYDEGWCLMLDMVTWDEDGWPLVGNGTPSLVLDVAPVFNK